MPALLDQIRERFTQRRKASDADFDSLADAVARDEEGNVDQAMATLDELGKTDADLAAAAELRSDRMRWHAQIAAMEPAKAAVQKLQRQIDAAKQKHAEDIARADAELDAVITPLIQRRDEENRKTHPVPSPYDALRRTADPALKAQEAELLRQLNEARPAEQLLQEAEQQFAYRMSLHKQNAKRYEKPVRPAGQQEALKAKSAEVSRLQEDLETVREKMLEV